MESDARIFLEVAAAKGYLRGEQLQQAERLLATATGGESWFVIDQQLMQQGLLTAAQVSVVRKAMAAASSSAARTVTASPEEGNSAIRDSHETAPTVVASTPRVLVRRTGPSHGEPEGPRDAVPWTAIPPEHLANDARYELRSVLGEGGMGVVRIAYDPAIRREVAYKAIRTSKPGDKSFSRFVHEAQITGQLEHPNIVPVHEVGQTAQGMPYFTMKWVRGQSLRERLDAAREAVRSGGTLEQVFPLGERLDVIRKIAQAMGYAHAHEVIHRDLKPENVMLGDHGEVSVMDWGLAKIVRNEIQPGGLASSKGRIGRRLSLSKRSSRRRPVVVRDADHWVESDRHESGSNLTMAGSVAGTPQYMAPEQAAGEVDRLDGRTDLFALGALLYELLSLVPPYDGDAPDTISLLRRAMEADWEPIPSRIRKTWRGRIALPPRELMAIAHKAMAERPAHRYQTAAAFIEDLDRFTANRSVSAARDGAFRQLVKWTRRQPTLALGIGAALVLGLVTALLLSQLGASEQQRLRAQAEAEWRQAQAAEAVAQQELAEAIAREQAARAQEAEETTARLGEVVRSRLSEESLDALESFKGLWEAARDRGESDTQFRQSLTPAQVDQFHRAYRDYFEVLAILQQSPGVEDYLHRALIRFAAGDTEGAIEDYTQALVLHPDDAMAYNNRGVARHMVGDHAGAERDFDAAIRLKPDFSGALVNRGNARRALGASEEAIEDYNEALRLNPDHVDAYNNRGILHSDLGEYDAAIRDFTEALRLNPNLVEAYVNRGITRNQMQAYTEAIPDFDAALRLNPAFHRALFGRGVAHCRLGRYADAIADFNEALQLNPDDAETVFQRAIARRGQRDFEGALRDFDEALRLDPSFANAYNNRGALRFSLGHPEEAIQDYNAALRVNPDMVEAYVNRGNARQSLGDPRGAIRDYTEALGLDPDNATIYCNRGASYNSLHEFREAIRNFDAAIRLNPTLAPAFYNRGTAHKALRAYQQALQDFTEALQLDPDYPEPYNSRGSVRAALGEFATAIEDFDEAIRLRPAYSEAFVNRGNARRGLHDIQGALEDYNQAIEINPELWQAWVNRGVVLAQRGDRDAAVDAFAAALEHCPPKKRQQVEQIRRQVLGE